MSEQIGVLIKNLDHDLQRYSSRQAKQLGITQVQMSIIDFLYRNEAKRDLYQIDVEHEFNIQKSSATALLQLMEKKSLIVRAPSTKDSRFKIIVLTARARQYATQIRQLFDQNDDTLKQILGKDADLFVRQLQKLHDYMTDQLK